MGLANRLFIQRPGVAVLTAMRWALRHPRVTLGLFALTWMVCAVRLGDMRFLLSIGDMIDRDSPIFQTVDSIHHDFPAGHTLAVTFYRASGTALTNEQLCQIKLWMDQQNVANVEIRDVQSPFQYRTGTYDPARLTLQYPARLQLDCYHLGMGPVAPGQIAWMDQTPLRDVLVAKGGQAVVVDLELRDTKQKNPYGSFDPTPVHAVEQHLAATFGADPELRYFMQGAAAFKWYFLQSLTHDQGLNLGILIVLIGLFRLVYGRWRGGFLLAGTLVVTFCLLTALMTMCGAPFDILSNSLFVILALASTEDFLYLSYRQQQAGGDWRRHFARLALPSFYTSLTTCLGFGSLCVSELAPIRRLGLWAAVGGLVEWAVVFLALPALLKMVPRLRLWTAPGQRHAVAVVRRLGALRLPRPVAHALLAAMVAAVFGYRSLKSNDAVDSMWPETHPFTVGLNKVHDLFGWRGTIDVLVPESLSEGDQERILTRIAAHPNIAAMESPFQLLKAASATIADRGALRVLHEDFRNSAAFNRYFSPFRHNMRAMLYLRNIDLQSVDEVTAAVQEACKPAVCKVGGDVAYLATFSKDVIVTLLESFLASFVLVGATLYLLTLALNTTNKLALITSSLWGPVVMIGSLPILLGGVNFVTCVFAAVLVGLAGDNCIQFLFSARRRSLDTGVTAAQEGSVSIMLMMALCSLVFLASDFKQPKTLGLLFAGGYLCLLVGDLWLLRGLIGGGQPARAVTKPVPSLGRAS